MMPLARRTPSVTARALRALGSATVGLLVVCLIITVFLNWFLGCGTDLPGSSCFLIDGRF